MRTSYASGPGFAVLLAAVLGLACPFRVAAHPEAPTPPPGGAPVASDAEIRFTKQPVAANEYAAALTEYVLAARLTDHSEELQGVTLQSVGEALRAQLGLAAGQGLLVASVRENSPAAQAGLQANDILLTLAEKPLASAEDVARQLKAAGDAPLALKVLRAGKPLTLRVRPVYRVTLGPVAEQKTEYYLGVSIEPADDPLRAQLALPEGRGVLVTEVVSDSPAARVGVQKHDIVLELDGKPIDTPETLRAQVQAAQEKPLALKLLRGGKPLSLRVTPAARKVEAAMVSDALVQLWLIDQQPTLLSRQLAAYVTPAGQVDGLVRVALDRLQRLEHLEQELKALRRIESLEKELKALHQAMEKIHETLRAGQAPKRD